MISAELAHLIKMVNQIAASLNMGDAPQGAEKTAEHLRRFWSPAMREHIVTYEQRGGGGLSDAARRAVALLADSA